MVEYWHMATKADKARWARERNRRKKLGLPQPGRGDGLRKYDHTGPTYRTQPEEYRAWSGMKVRCSNPNFKDWKLYGGKRISVCARWRDSFEAFFLDLGPRPSPLHSLDRYPNNNGNYELGNVRWATGQEQARNWSTGNHFLECNGERLILSDWAKRLGITNSSLTERIARWPLDKALTVPAVRKRERAQDGTYAKAPLY